MRYVVGFVCVLALGLMPLVGCSDGESAVSIYASKDLWLCRPDIENDYCDTADLSTTEIRPDGTRVELTEVLPNPDAEIDCFYVYPTVNLSPEPGNTEPLFPHPESVIEIVTREAAHYRGVCRVFAPLYHQMSLITYWEFPFKWEPTEYFQRAYDDVVEAFEYYMRNHNEGRDFVLLGRSQGSHMLTRLLEDKFDDDEALRAQLLSALLLGPTNRTQVFPGELSGGSFTNIPLCTSADETGCVIAFDTNAAGDPAPHYDSSVFFTPPSARACVNPASLRGTETLAGLTYPRWYEPALPFPEDVDTEWVRYPNIYTSRCSGTDDWKDVLWIDLASEYTGEVPRTPLELQAALMEFRGAQANLHYVEDYLTYADLLPIVEQQIASRGN